MLLPNFIKEEGKEKVYAAQGSGDLFRLAPGSGGKAATAADFTFPPTRRGSQVCNLVKCFSVPLWTSWTHIDDLRRETVLTK